MPELLPLQMLSAVIHLNSDTEGWTLQEPAETPRIFRMPVKFEAPFPRSPLVHVALAGFDVDNAAAARLTARAVAIDPRGFTLELETWLDTRVYAVDVSWLAVGSSK